MEKILIISTEWGHSSIAKSVGQVVNKYYDVEIHSIKIEKFSKVSYEFIYKFIPGFFKLVFALSEVNLIKQIFGYYAEKSYKKQLEHKIHEARPKIVVNTYFAFNSSLESLKNKYGFRLLNVIANPRTFTKIEISPYAENLVFDKYSFKKVKAANPNNSCTLTGWFTESKFYEVKKEKRARVRKMLGLDPNKFTLCITSGSEGTYNVLKIVNTFLNPKYNMQVIIMCGNNSQLLKTAKTLKSVSKTIGGPEIAGIPYTTEVQKYLRASDIVVGKAGPNTIFESVATLTPFFAISHVSGQENGNLEIIKKYKIGYVEEKPVLATLRLKEIIENPKILSKFQNNLKALSAYNQNSERKLLKLLRP